MRINGAPIVQLGVSFFTCSVRKIRLTKEMLGSNPEFSIMPLLIRKEEFPIKGNLDSYTSISSHFQTLTFCLIPSTLFPKEPSLIFRLLLA